MIVSCKMYVWLREIYSIIVYHLDGYYFSFSINFYFIYSNALFFLILLLHILNCNVLLIKMCLCEIILFSNASVQFSHSVMSNSLWPPWTTAHQASLSNSQRLLKLTSIELVMPSNHLILCHPLLLLPSVFPSIRVFSDESVFHIR